MLVIPNSYSSLARESEWRGGPFHFSKQEFPGSREPSVTECFCWSWGKGREWKERERTRQKKPPAGFVKTETAGSPPRVLESMEPRICILNIFPSGHISRTDALSREGRRCCTGVRLRSNICRSGGPPILFNRVACLLFECGKINIPFPRGAIWRF